MAGDLRDWIRVIEEAGSIKRIQQEVHWDQEMAAITYLRHKKEGAPALLFENIVGYPDGYRVLFNALGSSAPRTATAMGEEVGISEPELIDRVRDKFRRTIEPQKVDGGDSPVYENTFTGQDVDIEIFPAPKMWPKDGGRYIGTANATIHRDPETGILNVGTYRQMIQSERQIGIYTSPGKDLRLDMEKCWENGESLDVAVVYGIEPALFIASGMMIAKDESEYELAGGLRESPIEVVEAEHTGLPVPANAEIIVEGELRPNDTMLEGPFGEFTGYYGRPEDDTPVMTINAIHHRNDPILTSALMADYPASDHSMLYTIGRSAMIWNDLDRRLGVPGIKGVYCPPEATSTAMTVVSIEQQYAGHTSQVGTLAAQCSNGAYFSKLIVIVDEDIDPTDMNQVIWAIATRFNPEDDIDILTDTWSSWLDPAQVVPEERPYGSKAIIDAAKDHKHYDQFSERSAISEETYQKILEKWDQLGFEEDPVDPPLFVEEAKGKIARSTQESQREM